MTNPVSPAGQGVGLNVPAHAQTQPAPGTDKMSEMGKRFEQMLWAEMLSHAGLEKAFTQGGGEAAASFSRYIVEAIAADLAESHPLGFAQQIDVPDMPEVASVPGETE